MKINNFKMKVNPEQSMIVQKILFKNGYRWGISRDEVRYTEYQYLYDEYIYYYISVESFNNAQDRELTFNEFMIKYNFKFGK